jgi:LPS sulfotransferase NodH
MAKRLNTRFILLSTARTGSNLLTFLLRDHQHVTMHGEIFNLHALNPSQLKKALTTPLSYMAEYFDPGGSAEIKAVGFKQFYNHLRPEYFMSMDQLDETPDELNKKILSLLSTVTQESDVEALFDRFEKTWQYLQDAKDIKVIHLKRDNKFEILVSLKTAFITDQWYAYQGQDAPKTLLKVQPEECRSFFEYLDFYEKRHADMFRTHPLLDVEYQHVVEDGEKVLQKIFEFLHIPPAPLTTTLKKQIAHPVNELVTNYAELKQHFQNTQWSRYFHL